MNYLEALEKAADLEKRLDAKDPRFNYFVALGVEDGSNFFHRAAFLVVRENWVFVFAEHHGFRVYDKNELTYYYMLEYVEPTEAL